jgi:hypothetical protein
VRKATEDVAAMKRVAVDKKAADATVVKKAADDATAAERAAVDKRATEAATTRRLRTMWRWRRGPPRRRLPGAWLSPFLLRWWET